MTVPQQRISGTVSAVNGTTVDVQALGGALKGLQYPGWYNPTVGDAVIVEWMGQQPYVAQAFAGALLTGLGAYRSGQSYSSPHTNRSTCIPSVGNGGAIPFPVQRKSTWTAMGVEVTGASTSGLVRLALYADGGHGYPAGLINIAGAAPTGTTGAHFVNFPAPLTLPPGLYWLAFQVETSPATLRSVTNTVSGLAGMVATAGSFLYDGLFSGNSWTAGTMPTTFPTGLGQQANLPLILITAA